APAAPVRVPRVPDSRLPSCHLTSAPRSAGDCSLYADGHEETGVPHGSGADPQLDDDPGQLRLRRLGAGPDRPGRDARAAGRLLQAGEAVTPEQKIAELGLELPEVVKPLAAYVPTVRTGNLVYTSGQVPVVKGEVQFTGKVGAEVSVEDGQAAARTCAL